MPDLHARLLAEIERREEANTYRYWHGESTGAQESLAYLAALREIVALHAGAHQCHDLEGTVDIVRDECATVLVIAGALGVEP